MNSGGINGSMWDFSKCRAVQTGVSLLSGSAALLLSGAVLAQSNGGSVAETMLEEITVTAEKRTERLQDVPLAVSAISGTDLVNLQLRESTGLVNAVPSLTFQQGANPQNSSFRIRGIGTSLFGVGTVSSVALILDGVPTARQAQSFFNFADIERIEVLRGPQGTLFGEGASAGAINVVTRAPTSVFEGLLSTTGAQGDEYRVSGTVSGPLGGKAGWRLTGYYNNVGGIMPQAVSSGEDENAAEDWGLRTKFVWDASSALKLTFTAGFTHNADTCCAPVLINAVNPAFITLNGGVTAGPENRSVSDDGTTFSNSKQQLYSVQLDYALDNSTFTSITGYQNFELSNNNEGDSILNPTPVFVGGNNGPAFAQFNLQGGIYTAKQASQEFRFATDGTSRLDYVAGVYLQDLTIDRDFSRRRAYCAAGTAAQLGTPCTPTSFQSYNVLAKVDSKIGAVFGQLDYQLAGGLKTIFGLRAQYEDISTSGQPGGFNGTGPIVSGDAAFGSAVAGEQSTTDTSFSGKAGLQYEFSRNAQVYGTYTRGFKGAGFNASPTTNYATQLPVEPEYVNAYELGFKGSLWDGRFTVQTAAFLEDYSDLQVQIALQDPIAGTLTATQTNAGTSTSKGAEIEAILRPISGLSISAAATYADTSIDLDALGCPLQLQSTAITPTGAPPVNQCYRQQGQALINIRDGQLPASPKLRVTFAPRYVHGIGGNMSGFAQFSVNRQSSQVFDLNQDSLLKQDGYTLVDVSAGFFSNDDRYGVTFFVKNAFDKNYYTNMFHAQFLATAANPFEIYANIDKQSKRYFGATLEAKF